MSIMDQLISEVSGIDKDADDYEEVEEKLQKTLRRIDELQEINPMLGHRGCRLGIMYPEITEMQVRAIIKAACDVARSKKEVRPEIMIPLSISKIDLMPV